MDARRCRSSLALRRQLLPDGRNAAVARPREDGSSRAPGSACWIIMIRVRCLGTTPYQNIMKREIPRLDGESQGEGATTQSMPVHHRYAIVGPWSKSRSAVGLTVRVSKLGDSV